MVEEDCCTIEHVEQQERPVSVSPVAAMHHQSQDTGVSGLGEFEESGYDTVRCILNTDGDRGVGRLCVRESDIVWQGSGDALVIPFKDVSLSALADCPERYADTCPLGQCLYLQIDTGDDDDAYDDDDDDDGEDDDRLEEVHMFASSAEDVEAMFKAMCDGALRNPDSDAEEEQGHMFFDMESAVMGSFEDTLAITEDEAEQCGVEE